MGLHEDQDLELNYRVSLLTDAVDLDPTEKVIYTLRQHASSLCAEKNPRLE